MGIWGKIVGGMAGLALAGPMGGLLGGLAGHAVDKLREEAEAEDEAIAASLNQERPAKISRVTRETTFTIAVITLGAKLAKADGVVSRAEINAFKRVFHIRPQQTKEVARIFNEARRDPAGFDVPARQIARLHQHNPRVLEDLMNGLLHIAKADGEINDAEMNVLRQVAVIFSMAPARFERLIGEHGRNPAHDPYQVLGVPQSIPDDLLKSTYHKLIRENHPDKLVAQGMPRELIELANHRLAAINDAYRLVRLQRGLR